MSLNLNKIGLVQKLCLPKTIFQIHLISDRAMRVRKLESGTVLAVRHSVGLSSERSSRRSGPNGPARAGQKRQRRRLHEMRLQQSRQHRWPFEQSRKAFRSRHRKFWEKHRRKFWKKRRRTFRKRRRQIGPRKVVGDARRHAGDAENECLHPGY